MKNLFNNQIQQGALLFITAVMMLASCNKDIPVATPIPPPPPTGTQTMSQIIAANPNYSFLAAAITRAGTGLSFNPADATAVYTFFAPNDAAFIASGIPSIAVINSLPAATVAAILNYHVIPGLLIKYSDISTAFPNMYLQSTMVLGPTPVGFYRNSIFPSRRTAGVWANNIPIVATDIMASNGVMHTPAGLVSPPSATLKTMIAADTSLTLFMAAVTRADSGQAEGAKLDSALRNPAANLTVFAPKNSAFRAMFPPGTPDAVIIALLNNPAFFTAQTVRGLVAYHMLGSRVFTVNMPTTSTLVNTLLSIPNAPPTPPTVVPVFLQLNGNNATVKGLANATASNVVAANQNAVNGVVNAIDQTLRPQ